MAQKTLLHWQMSLWRRWKRGNGGIYDKHILEMVFIGIYFFTTVLCPSCPWAYQLVCKIIRWQRVAWMWRIHCELRNNTHTRTHSREESSWVPRVCKFITIGMWSLKFLTGDCNCYCYYFFLFIMWIFEGSPFGRLVDFQVTVESSESFCEEG